MARTFEIQIPDGIDIHEPFMLVQPEQLFGDRAILSQGGNNWSVSFVPLPSVMQPKPADLPEPSLATHGTNH